MSKSKSLSSSRFRITVFTTVTFLAVAGFVAQIFLTRGVQAVSNTVVISQVYGGGGNASAPYRNDFVELFNRGTTTVSLSGWSVQYASAAGTGNFSGNNIATLSGSIAPGQNYLVRLGNGGGTVGVLLPAQDASGTQDISGTAGKVVLANTTTGLTCNGGSAPCSPAQLAQIVDLVGYGSTANFFEGSAPAPAPSNTTAIFRAASGCTETDNNSADFSTGAPTPRNTASPTHPCPTSNFTLNVGTAGDGSGTVTSSSGGISCPGTCSASYPPGTPVTLTAVANAGSAFTNWSGCDSTSGNTCNVTMTANKSVTATFTATQQTLNVTKNGTGGGTVTSSPAGINCGATCSTTFSSGTLVTLTAVADGTSTFTSWNGCDSFSGNQCNVAMNSTRNVTATFTTTQRVLTVSRTGTGTGTVTSSPAGINCGATCFATYADNTAVTLTAAASLSNTFDGWTGCDSTSGNTCNVTMSSDKTITASFTFVPTPPGSVVISQIYGGGGNSGSTLTNDFIEIFNRSQNTVNLAGLSVQYASAAGTSWAVTPLSGSLAPGQYYLVREGAGGTTNLPTPDATGTINMNATNAKVALVQSTVALSGSCPTGLIDLVGYGTADCFEGSAAAPQLSNTTAALRAHSGCTDSDNNSADFSEVAPSPRNSSTTTNVCPATGDFPPAVLSTSPANGGTNVAIDANITVTFDEFVNVTSNWFQLSCTNTGIHSGVTTGGPKTFTINPDVDLGNAEQCTVTIYKNEISDQDSADPPDNMDADYIFTFATAIIRNPAEHMVMGNPSGAVTDENVPLNYLMMKPQYALSYNNDKGTPNWTSWHLDSTWTTSVADRQDDFRPDDTLPATFTHVSSGYNFNTYHFDRGHMCPSADRTPSVEDNSATFLMTNMIPQASGNNQGPWNELEGYIRTQLSGTTNEIYIVSGPQGVGGNSTTGHWDSIQDTGGNTVTVPQKTWKVIMVLPNANGDDVARVDNATRTFAVIMPNDDNIRPDQWQKYLATVDQVEALTGYNFFSNAPGSVQDVIEARLDLVNDTAPVANSGSTSVAEDNSRTITLSASDFNVNNVLTFTVASGPSHGMLGTVSAPTCSNGNCTATVTYTPASDYNGPDSFTFTVNDGALNSAIAANISITVTEVNDDPIAVNDSQQTTEDSSLNFAAADLTTNDSTGPNESGQTLTVDAVISTPNTHGNVTLSAGQVSYTPEANYNGAASFDYHVCDNGTTNGVAQPKCATATVNVSVESVNDGPSAVDDSATTDEDTPATINVLTNDSDIDTDSLTVSGVTQGAHGSVTNNGSNVTYSPAANYYGGDSFSYTVSDGHGGTATANVSVTINAVNDNPVAVADSATTNEDNPVTIDVVANDTDVDGDSPSLTSVGSAAHGSVTIVSGKAVYSPAGNYNGNDSFGYVISDGHGGQANGVVSITVNAVNDAPAANDQSVTTPSNTPVPITLTGSDTETPSSLTFTVTSLPSHGSLTGTGANRSYTPGLNYSGPDSFKFTVTDAGDGSSPALTSAEATVAIFVNDTVAPTITLTGTPISLWPQDKNLHTINVADLVASASDNYDASVNLNSVVIASITSDEGTAANGDIVIAGNCKSVQLRATRDGNGDGRVYTITFRARDASGNTSFVTATVTVPHDQGNGAAGDSGVAYTINSSCP